MSQWKGLVHSVKRFVSKNSSELLTGLGIAGWITTVVLAVRETPKATKVIEEIKNEKETNELRPSEVIQATWKCYVWPFIFGVASTTCIIAANVGYKKRYMALTAVYKLSEEALHAYEDSIVETVGEEKATEIREKVHKKQLETHPTKNEIIIAGSGQYLCYEPIGNMYFNSDSESIKAAINNLNHQMLVDEYATLNDFYDELGLKHVTMGNTLGWTISKGMIDYRHSAQVSDDGRPCLVIEWLPRPSTEFLHH